MKLSAIIIPILLMRNREHIHGFQKYLLCLHYTPGMFLRARGASRNTTKSLPLCSLPVMYCREKDDKPDKYVLI